MKKLLVLFIIVTGVKPVVAQQKIHVDAMHIMMLQLRINPDDPSWRTFKAPVSQYQGAPFFVADAYAPFFSKEEVDGITVDLDKLLNPDKYFSKQEEYAVFYEEFQKKMREKHTRR